MPPLFAGALLAGQAALVHGDEDHGAKPVSSAAATTPRVVAQSEQFEPMIGSITLAGISARNGILKVSHTIRLVLFEGETFGRGSLERLAPVLLTALSAGLAPVPLLYGAGEPGREILRPVAVTIFGGLVSATLLDTFLTPVLFLAISRKPLERITAARSSVVKPITHAEAF